MNNKIKPKKDDSNLFSAFLAIFLILLFSIIFMQTRINNMSPEFDTISLKNSKLTKLTNAYFNDDDNLVGITSNRNQVQYRIQKGSNIRINKSGTVSIYPAHYYSNDFEDYDVAISKTDKTKAIKNNIKKDMYVHNLKSMRNKLVIAEIMVFVVWIALLQPVLNKRQSVTISKYV